MIFLENGICLLLQYTQIIKFGDSQKPLLVHFLRRPLKIMHSETLQVYSFDDSSQFFCRDFFQNCRLNIMDNTVPKNTIMADTWYNLLPIISEQKTYFQNPCTITVQTCQKNMPAKFQGSL